MSLWNLFLQMYPFGLRNKPATFERCMHAIFAGFVEELVQVFMNDLSFYGTLMNTLTILTKFHKYVRKLILS